MPDYNQFQIILDVPAKSPELNFGQFGNAFRDIIEGSEPRFSIGIFGGWGAGKTTLMTAIRDRLDPAKCVAVDFSAWRYEKEEHLIIPLLDVVRNSLNQWAETQRSQKIKKVVRKTASVIGGVTESILRGITIKGGIPKLLDLPFDANKTLTAAREWTEEEARRLAPRSFYFASFESLKDCFAEFHKASGGARIVVFIDDLDRCLPESALEVLESMKLFFDFDGFVFVVGLDQQVVEWCIDNRYAEYQVLDTDDGFRIRGADYIKKIFQVPFTLPPVAQVEAETLLNAVIENVALHEDQIDDLRIRLRPHLEFLLENGSTNLRDIKRFLNSYTLIMKVHAGLDPDVVVALQTLAFTPDWREAFDAIRVYGDELMVEIGNMIGGNDHCIGEIAPELGSIPLSFERYLQPGAPGQVLLTTNDLAMYINLATSATAADVDGASGYSFQYLDLLRNVAKARRAASEARTSLSYERLFERLQVTRDNIRSIYSMAQEMPGFGGANSLLYTIEDLGNRVDQIMQDTTNRINAPTQAPNATPDADVVERVGDIGDSLTDISQGIRQIKARGNLGRK